MIGGRCHEVISELRSLVGTQKEMCIQQKSNVLVVVGGLLVVVVVRTTTTKVIKIFRFVNEVNFGVNVCKRKKNDIHSKITKITEITRIKIRVNQVLYKRDSLPQKVWS